MTFYTYTSVVDLHSSCGHMTMTSEHVDFHVITTSVYILVYVHTLYVSL
jgi:hypothetical protein